MNKNGSFYKINNLIKEKRFSEAEYILENEIEDKLKKSKPYYSLLIRTKIKLSKLNEIEILIKTKKLMKRDYLIFIKEIYENDLKKALYIFNNFVKKNHQLYEKEIDFLIENKMIEILNELDNYYAYTNLDSNNKKNIKSKIYNLNLDLLINNFTNNVKNDKLDKLKNFINKNNFNIVIDFGNVLHSCSKNNFNKYKRLKIFLKSVNKNYNPLIIAHPINFKKKKTGEDAFVISEEIKNKFNNNIFFTPYNFNDDIFILISAILINCKIVSRDNFSDHLNNLKSNEEKKIFQTFLNQSLTNYKFNKLENKEIYNNCIQVLDNKILIPTKDKKFYIIKKNKSSFNIFYFALIVLSFYILINFFT